MAISRTCSCGRRVSPGERCPCKPAERWHPPQSERVRRQPWRRVYTLASYRTGRAERYRLVGGRCERCGVPLKGELHPRGARWECDHRIPARRFADLDVANHVSNLQCLCRSCHRSKTRATR